MFKVFRLRTLLLALTVLAVQSCNDQEDVPSPTLRKKGTANTESSLPCTDWYNATTGEYITTTGNCTSYTGGTTSSTGTTSPTTGMTSGGGSTSSGTTSAGTVVKTAEPVAPMLGNYAALLTYQLDKYTAIKVLVEIDREAKRIQKITVTGQGQVPFQTLNQIGEGIQTAFYGKTETYKFSVNYQIATGTSVSGTVILSPVRTLTATVSPVTNTYTWIKP